MVNTLFTAKEELNSNSSIAVEADIIDYGSFNADLESVILHWKYSAEDGPFGEITLELQSNNIYIGTFPSLNSNSFLDIIPAIDALKHLSLLKIESKNCRANAKKAYCFVKK